MRRICRATSGVLTEEDQRSLRRRARAQRILPARQLVHERRAQHRFRRTERANGGRIDLPVLFLHGAYDYVCETINSRLAEPMRALAPTSPRQTFPRDTGWRRKSPPSSTPLSPNGWRKSCPRFGSPPDAQRTVTMARDAFASFGSHPNQSAFRSCGELLGQ